MRVSRPLPKVWIPQPLMVHSAKIFGFETYDIFKVLHIGAYNGTLDQVQFLNSEKCDLKMLIIKIVK